MSLHQGDSGWVCDLTATMKPFSKFVKKQHKPFQAVIEDEVLSVCENPTIGEAKIGDLAGIHVHKFTHKRQQYLMAYYVPDVESMSGHNGENIAEHESPPCIFIDFYQAGPHENFYDALQTYLKADGWYK